jgi:hypothetical protein
MYCDRNYEWPNEQEKAKYLKILRILVALTMLLEQSIELIVELKHLLNIQRLISIENASIMVTLRAPCDPSLRYTDCFVGYPSSDPKP